VDEPTGTKERTFSQDPFAGMWMVLCGFMGRERGQTERGGASFNCVGWRPGGIDRARDGTHPKVTV
jgi:hypothetical protein